MLLSQQGSGVGGAERVAIIGLSRARSLDVTVVAPRAQCQFAESLGLPSVEMELPRLRSPALGPLRLAARSFQVARLAKRLEAGVIYANAIRAIGYALGARLLGAPPIVAHQHHMLSSEDKHGLGGGLFNRKAFLRALDRWAELIVVPSRAAARPFGGSAKVRVIPNGIDLDSFRPPADPALAKESFGLRPDSLVVGTLTRADPDKGMQPFLSLAGQIADAAPQTQFLMAGGASFPHEIPHYRRVAEQAKVMLGDNLSLTGYLEDPVRAFHAMDVMVHTSGQAESFGLTVVEAMACGVPVVAYDWGAVSEVIDEHSGLLVPPQNQDAAVHSVLRLLKDPDLRAAMAKAARARCEKNYRIEAFIDSMTEALESVA